MNTRKRKPQDVGSDSPASGEAKEQRIAGARGGPQEARTPPRVAKQPPQTSATRSAGHRQVPKARKTFAPEEDPSKQGAGEPGPEQLKERPSLQGIGGQSGSHSAQGERTEEEAQAGEPKAGHAWRGRQHLPGDRAPKRTEE